MQVLSPKEYSSYPEPVPAATVYNLRNKGEDRGYPCVQKSSCYFNNRRQKKTPILDRTMIFLKFIPRNIGTVATRHAVVEVCEYGMATLFPRYKNKLNGFKLHQSQIHNLERETHLKVKWFYSIINR